MNLDTKTWTKIEAVGEVANPGELFPPDHLVAGSIPGIRLYIYCQCFKTFLGLFSSGALIFYILFFFFKKHCSTVIVWQI